jgi:hypothetical protein
MTPLRQRFIEDMHLRGLAPTTERSYLHYVLEYAKFYNSSPEKLDLEAGFGSHPAVRTIPAARAETVAGKYQPPTEIRGYGISCETTVNVNRT